MLVTAAMAQDTDRPVRVAYFHTELSRDGPGLLLRDITRGKDPQVAGVLDVIAAARPDVLVLQGLDWDHDGHALRALMSAIRDHGIQDFAYSFAAKPNRGMPTGFDLDGNGRSGDPQDRQGYALFTGENGLAVLSKFPLGDVRDLSGMLWADLPEALLPWPGQPEGLEDVIRLSTTNHWVVPVLAGQTPITLRVFAATNPVFDGPEDRNGRRNHDEIAFWDKYLAGTFGPVPDGFVLTGNANLDPDRGDGRREMIRALLAHTALQDPDELQGKPTVDWGRDDLPPMRVSYVLPASTWRVLAAGMITPQELPAAATASRHRLIWVDLAQDQLR